MSIVFTRKYLTFILQQLVMGHYVHFLAKYASFLRLIHNSSVTHNKDENCSHLIQNLCWHFRSKTQCSAEFFKSVLSKNKISVMYFDTFLRIFGYIFYVFWQYVYVFWYIFTYFGYIFTNFYTFFTYFGYILTYFGYI